VIEKVPKYKHAHFKVVHGSGRNVKIRKYYKPIDKGSAADPNL
jgi:hypothetical protein